PVYASASTASRWNHLTLHPQRRPPTWLAQREFWCPSSWRQQFGGGGLWDRVRAWPSRAFLGRQSGAPYRRHQWPGSRRGKTARRRLLQSDTLEPSTRGWSCHARLGRRRRSHGCGGASARAERKAIAAVMWALYGNWRNS